MLKPGVKHIQQLEIPITFVYEQAKIETCIVDWSQNVLHRRRFHYRIYRTPV